MFCPQGFGHRGEDCTFETLRKEVLRPGHQDKADRRNHSRRGPRRRRNSHAGRTGLGQSAEWLGKQELPDDELLERGMELIEGLYESLAMSARGRR